MDSSDQTISSPITAQPIDGLLDDSVDGSIPSRRTGSVSMSSENAWEPVLSDPLPLDENEQKMESEMIKLLNKKKKVTTSAVGKD